MPRWIVVADPDAGASPVTWAIAGSGDPRLRVDSHPLQGWLEPLQAHAPCPACARQGAAGGRLTDQCRGGRHFAVCSNSHGRPACDYIQPACRVCGIGLLVDAGAGLFECSTSACSSTQPGCCCRPPRPMVVRRSKGADRPFWGCFRYGQRSACALTRPVD